METYGIKIAPIWIPMEPTAIRPLIEAHNCFTDKKIESDKLLVCRYVGLPQAVLAHFEKKYNKQGNALIKKIGQMLQVTPMRGAVADKITEKMGFRHVFIDAIILTFFSSSPALAFC